VISYHTHVPEYIKSYTWRGLVEPCWMFIRSWTRNANLMLVTSAVMETELAQHACRSRRLALWKRGVDIDIFNPSFKSAACRELLSGGHPEAPLLVHIGRLGAEKNIAVLKGAHALSPLCTQALTRFLSQTSCLAFPAPASRSSATGRAAPRWRLTSRCAGVLTAPSTICLTLPLPGHAHRLHRPAQRRRAFCRLCLRRRLPDAF
jgi:hypothetical protein